MKNIYLIGNAHLDPVWLWQWQEGFAEIKATFRSALDRMKEFDDYKFTSACGAYYMWIEKSDKAMFEEIKQRVKEGRWCITGGWLIQPDCNMPDGESFARHALISQRYFKEKFGITAEVGYNVDSFGHNGNLPQILKKSGMNSYVFMRPGKHEKDLPANLFNWQSMDGSSVKAFRIHDGYNAELSTMYLLDEVNELAQKQNTDMMGFYGVGNHGGGATIEILDHICRTKPDNFVFSTPNEYFEKVRGVDVPIVCDDLQYHAKGCYSATSEIKADNQKAEYMLCETEAFSVLSQKLMDTPYPKAELDTAWKNVLFNQFHDIMCGCSIREAYTDAKYVHGEAMSIAQRNTNFALQQISWNIDTMRGKTLAPYRDNTPPVGAGWRGEDKIGTPIVVFNPHAYEVKTVVAVRDMPKYITDENSELIPIQYIRDSKTNTNVKYKVAFTATIPPLGYAVYRMHFEEEKPQLKTEVSASDTHIENKYIRAEFDRATGELCAIIDKTTGKNLIQKGACPVLMDETDSDTWSHGIDRFKNKVSQCTKGTVKMTENGPVRASVRAEQMFENTRIRRDYYLGAENREIKVKVKIDFYEKHKMLKFTLPVLGENPKSYAQIPYGFIERPTDGTEQVFGRWVSLGGVGIATDSRHSFDADGNVLSLTVLRGAIYADHAGQRDEFCEYAEQGESFFTYSIFPYSTPSDATKKAQMLNLEPQAVVETFHKGSLGTEFSGISIDKENIIVSAIKKNEDSDAVTVRCYEADNVDTTAKIKIFDTEFEAKFGHNEIKTFVVDGKTVKETNLIEW